ncbi:hypothetical protein [Robiginitalea sp. IMCC43444]|uniref:hypothetical protein n=1 Tax=Robiginitalea sp. IMCC43444 TaxID=3459121 RepID=UPI0040427D50
MKNSAHLFLIAFVYLTTFASHGQITKTKVKSPSLNTGVSSPVGLPDTFDEVINGLKTGQCFNIALTSLQLNPTSTAKKDYKVETRHGAGALKIDGKNLVATFNIEAGLNENGSRRVLSTTLKLRKSSSGLVMDIRNSQYYHLIYELTLVKKKNGYYLIAERDENSMTVAFTLSIFKTTCLI